MVDSSERGAKNVEIADGQSSATLEVTTNDDETWETSTRVIMRIAPGDYTISSSAGSRSVSVLDNDFPDARAMLEVLPSTVDEGGSVTASVTVTTDFDEGPNEGGGTIRLSTVDGTAANGADYTAPTTAAGLLSFTASDFDRIDLDDDPAVEDWRYRTTKQVTIPIADDTTSENAETFTVSIEKVTTGPMPTDINITLAEPKARTVSIDANIAPTVTRPTVTRPSVTRPSVTRPSVGTVQPPPGAGTESKTDEATGTEFSDTADLGVHTAAVTALADDGVLDGTGCGDGRLCPRAPLQRWEMAVWLVRILDGTDLDPADASRFDDIDADTWWAAHVERLIDLGITEGCAVEPLRYCPDEPVTRDQMASFLKRAFRIADAESGGFVDTRGNTHEASIDDLYAVEITEGCATEPLRYCPADDVTRAQTASLLDRARNRDV